jgi:magnesium-transporting ATPase (P-type)
MFTYSPDLFRSTNRMLTGESLPVEADAGADTYAGALVRRGEAAAKVTATGVHTKFGRTAELVLTTHSVSSQQTAVLRIVRNLAIFNGIVIALIFPSRVPNQERLLNLTPARSLHALVFRSAGFGITPLGVRRKSAL